MAVFRRWLWWGGPLAAAMLFALLSLHAGSRPVGATHLCGNTGSSAGAFNFQAYEDGDWRTTYSRALALAGRNQLFPDVPSFTLPQLETGARSAGSGQLAQPFVPARILSAIAWIESSWAQAALSVPYGSVGPALVSHDCGYGIMQVTTGMQNTTGVASLDQAMIGGHYAFNIARGAEILAEKWNAAPEFRPIVGSRDFNIVENWYFAVWSYNGFSFKNHPLNPAFSLPRPAYRCDGSQSRSNYPYQELIYGCVANPPTPSGQALWNALGVQLPNLSDPAFSLSSWNACRGSFNCAVMDIATPNPSTTDSATTSLTRSQVIGSPQLSVSQSQVSLVTIPPVVMGSAPIVISNTGTGPLAWRTSPSASWLKVSPRQGVSLGTDLGPQTSTVVVEADPTGRPPGKYTATLTVDSLWASGSPATVSITLFNYPDGTLVQASGTGVYVMRGGLKRAIRNAVTFEANGFEWSSVKQLPQSVLAAIQSGQPLLDAVADGNLLTATGRGVYVMEGGVRRHIINTVVFSACGYGWDAVQGVAVGRLDAIAEGAAVTGSPCPQLLPPDGTLVAKSGGGVHLMQRGLKRLIPNVVTFEAGSYQWGNVNQLPESVLAAIPGGQPVLDAMADGNLLTATGRGVYAMEGGVKRHIINTVVFSACGYGWDAVQGVAVGRLDAIAEGADVTGSPCPQPLPADGTLVAKSGGGVHVMQRGLKRLIPNVVTFEAGGYQWGNVNQLPESAMDAIPTGAPLLDPLADGNLLIATGRGAYVMEGGVRRHIINTVVFSACGYGWDAVQGVAVGRLDAIAEGAAVTGSPCPQLLPADGTLVAKSGGGVHVMQRGLKRLIPNVVTFEAGGYQWGNVNQLPESAMDAIPTGAPLLDSLADGNLLTATGRGVYVMEGGVKRLIINTVVFSACGYGWDAVQGVAVGRLDAIAEGADVTGSPCPQLLPEDGALIQGSTAAIYVMEGAKKRLIESPTVFTACGYASGNVNLIADSSLAAIPIGDDLEGGPCP